MPDSNYPYPDESPTSTDEAVPTEFVQQLDQLSSDVAAPANPPITGDDMLKKALQKIGERVVWDEIVAERQATNG